MPRGIPADLTGRRFGGWMVLGRDRVSESGAVLWSCRCDCENLGSVSTMNLMSGRSTRCRSCGNSRTFNSRYKD